MSFRDSYLATKSRLMGRRMQRFMTRNSPFNGYRSISISLAAIRTELPLLGSLQVEVPLCTRSLHTAVSRAKYHFIRPSHRVQGSRQPQAQSNKKLYTPKLCNLLRKLQAGISPRYNSYAASLLWTCITPIAWPL